MIRVAKSLCLTTPGPRFNELLFGHRRPTYVAFDLLIANGLDLRPLPLRDRRTCSNRQTRRGWIALTNRGVGEGRALYQAMVAADLEGIVAKKLADPYNPKLIRWHKILNRDLLAASRAH